MADFIVASICMNDIPKDAFKVADNGKTYLNFIVAKRQEVGRYGHTHSIYLSQTQEERNAKANKVYIGDAKEHQMQHANTAPEPIQQRPAKTAVDDLPW